MRNQENTNSYFAEGHQRRILGFPERMLYRIGVLLFYVLLFFAVSVLSKKMPNTDKQVTTPKTTK